MSTENGKHHSYDPDEEDFISETMMRAIEEHEREFGPDVLLEGNRDPAYLADQHWSAEDSIQDILRGIHTAIKGHHKFVSGTYRVTGDIRKYVDAQLDRIERTLRAIGLELKAIRAMPPPGLTSDPAPGTQIAMEIVPAPQPARPPDPTPVIGDVYLSRRHVSAEINPRVMLVVAVNGSKVYHMTRDQCREWITSGRMTAQCSALPLATFNRRWVRAEDQVQILHQLMQRGPGINNKGVYVAEMASAVGRVSLPTLEQLEPRAIRSAGTTRRTDRRRRQAVQGALMGKPEERGL